MSTTRGHPPPGCQADETNSHAGPELFGSGSAVAAPLGVGGPHDGWRIASFVTHRAVILLSALSCRAGGECRRPSHPREDAGFLCDPAASRKMTADPRWQLHARLTLASSASARNMAMAASSSFDSVGSTYHIPRGAFFARFVAPSGRELFASQKGRPETHKTRRSLTD